MLPLPHLLGCQGRLKYFSSLIFHRQTELYPHLNPRLYILLLFCLRCVYLWPVLGQLGSEYRILCKILPRQGNIGNPENLLHLYFRECSLFLLIKSRFCEMKYIFIFNYKMVVKFKSIPILQKYFAIISAYTFL